MPELTLARLQELLVYCPATGEFRWRPNNHNSKCKAGKVAGHRRPDGHDRESVTIAIDRKTYRANQLAWLYMTGDWAAAQIDHRDLDRGNNRWDNLRKASNSQNQANTRVSKRNLCGFKGVRWSKRRRKWEARIKDSCRMVTLGYFGTPEEANAAYFIAAQKLHGEFARAA